MRYLRGRPLLGLEDILATSICFWNLYLTIEFIDILSVNYDSKSQLLKSG